MIIIDLVYNLLGLVALSVLSGFIDLRFDRKTLTGKLLQGFIFGLIAVTGMIYPYRYSPGVIFDGRSIVLSLCTLFFGPVAGGFASLIALVYRIHLAGSGLIMGSMVILNSFLIGCLAFYLKKRLFLTFNVIWLYAFGLIVHLAMLTMMLTLPDSIRADSYKAMSFTIIGIYPVMTVLIGKILYDQAQSKISFQLLKNSESLYKATLYSIGDAVITTDNLGRIKHMNGVAEKLTGWTEPEARNRQLEIVYRIFNEDTGENLDTPVNRVLHEGSVVGMVNHHILRSRFQKSIPVSDCGAPIKDEQGEIIGVVLVFRDQTEERLKILQLEESEKKFAAAFSNSPVAMLIATYDDGTCFDCNNVFLSETGYSLKEVHGLNIRSLELFDDSAQWEKIITGLSSAGRVSGIPAQLKKKDGTSLECLISVSILQINGIEYVLASFLDVTDQKRAEEKLIANQERYNSFMNANSDMISLKDENSRYLMINKSLAEFIGMSKDEICQKTDFELYGNEIGSFIRASDEKVLASDEIITYERTYSNRTLETTKFKIKLEQGKSGIGSIVRDITERKQSEILRQVQYNIANAMNTAPSLELFFSVVKEELGRLIDVSNFLYALYHPDTEMLSAPFEIDETNDGIHSWPVHQSLTGQVILRRKSLLLNRDEISGLADSGEITFIGKPAECWMGVPLIMDGKVLGAVVIQSYRDPKAYNSYSIEILETIANQLSLYIEKKRVEEESAKLSKAIVQSPASIVITDLAGNIEYANPKFTEITGYTLEEVLGKNPRFLKSGEGTPSFYEGLWQAIITGNEWHGDFLNRKKNGDLFWESANIAPIINQDGIITHFVAVKEDITEKKSMQNELISAKEKAEKSDKLKTVFLQNMSHEIRTPLNSIIGFSHLLNKEGLNNEMIKRYAAAIQSSGNRLLELINNLIDISRIESGNIEVHTKKFDLHRLIQEVCDQFKLVAASKKVELTHPYASGDSEKLMVSDPLKIHQILTNLVNNAFKFTNSGHIHVDYEIEDNQILFRVEDTGMGISKEHQALIFDRFYQANTSMSRGHEGSGLGLSICKGLVEALNGTIRVESELNVGSTFIVSLPWVAGKEERKTVVVESSLDLTGSLTVLVAEDDEFSFILLREILEQNGNKVIRASTGLEAIRLCNNHPDIDLVLMDLKMPEMNGLDATREIRKTHPELYIIAQSAYAFAQEKQAAFDAGCNDYLCKPISMDKLKSALASRRPYARRQTDTSSLETA